MADILPQGLLTSADFQTFQQDGVLVKEGVLSPEEVEQALADLSGSLQVHVGVDTENLLSTGAGLVQLSSTHGSGGVLDLFYDEWKIQIAAHPKLFSMTCQLWEAVYCHQGERLEELTEEETYRWQPYGPFDCQQGFCYIDRIGYRIPTALAEQLGQKIATQDSSSSSQTSSHKKAWPIQRSLTPHLDCCPDNLYQDKSKWRPIQCFLSLTDNLTPNTGGFEAAKGFHREFHRWAHQRPPSIITKRKGSFPTTPLETVSVPAPCIGDYTHIRPKEDRDVMNRIQHIPVPAGAAVFWDYRIPHANSWRHEGTVPRAVIYCSFLPDLALNRAYAAQQLRNWLKGRNPTDQWIHPKDEGEKESNIDRTQEIARFSPLLRRLLGLPP